MTQAVAEAAFSDGAATVLSPIPLHVGRELPPEMETLPRGDLLLGYQQRAQQGAAETALLVIEKSRQIGLTWSLASYAVLTAAASRAAGGRDVFYISYAKEMTREFIDTCVMWAKAFAIGVADEGEFLFEDQDEEGGSKRFINAYRIRFASGFDIVALASTPHSLRSKHGTVIIDEAAFVQDLAALLKAALAFLMWGGRVIVVSSHKGIDNPFNQLIDDIRGGRRRGKVLTITFAQAIADGIYERIRLTNNHNGLEKAEWITYIRGFYGDDAEEELDVVPAAGAGCWLEPADISACEHDDAGRPELYSRGLVVIGRDVARRRDLAVIWAFEIVGGHLWLRERYEGAKTSFRHQKTAWDRMFTEYRVLRAGIDQTGMGEVLVEQEQEQKGTDRVVGVLLTAPNRLDIAIALKKRVQEHTIHYPPDPAIRADFRAIKKSKGTGDSVRLVNDETVHADMFWAAGLACLVAETDAPATHGYQGVGRGQRGKSNAVRDRLNTDGRMRMRADERAPSRGRTKGTW